MNHWLELSIEYANQRSYLDDLFQVYPLAPEGIRDIDKVLWDNVDRAFNKRDNAALFHNLLRLKLFPVKDSYVAYFRHDKNAIDRNPATIARLCGRIYELGLAEVLERCSEPKETNRQIGPLFQNWLNRKTLGVEPIAEADFVKNTANAILRGSDAELLSFARRNFGYRRDKGIDFIGRFNGRYVIAEAKFLTDFGGHQDRQFEDAISILRFTRGNVIPIAILDGVLYIESRKKMYRAITRRLRNKNIMSALVLREFLYQL